MFESIADKCTKKLWTTALSALSNINSNYSHLEREAGPASCSLDFISSCCCYCIVYPVLLPLCIYPSWTLQTTCPSFVLHTEVGSHAFAEWFNPHLLILGLISIPETLSPVFPGCTAAFLRSTSWKVYFCADNISYIPCLLNAENRTIVCGAVRVSGGSESWLQAEGCRIPSKMTDNTDLPAPWLDGCNCRGGMRWHCYVL